MAPTKDEQIAELEVLRDAGVYDIGPAIPNFSRNNAPAGRPYSWTPPPLRTPVSERRSRR